MDRTSLIKKGLVVAVIFLFLGMCVTPSMGTVTEKKSTMLTFYNGNTLYVGGDGPGNYSKIQDAIDDASDGDTVFVFDNSSPYYENVVVDKSINLIGENRNSTVIDGGGIGKVVSIITDSLTITSFTIQNSGNGPYMGGIDVYSNNSCISNNIIRWNDFYGINLHYSNNNTITGNTIDSNIETGIDIFRSNNNIFSNNTISESRFGMDIWYSNNNIISKNYVTNNSRAMSLFNSKNNSILDNNLSFNVDAISLLYLSNYNTVSGNIILTNWDIITIHKTGVKINRSEGNSIYRNSISQHMFGILLENSSLNELTCNNLRRNIINAYFQNPSGCRNTWNNNYWNRPRLLPKPIFGIRTIGYRSIPWIQFDWHPAKKPYEI